MKLAMTVSMACDASAVSSISSLPVTEAIQSKVGSSTRLLLVTKWLKTMGALCILLAEVGKYVMYLLHT